MLSTEKEKEEGLHESNTLIKQVALSLMCGFGVCGVLRRLPKRIAKRIEGDRAE